MRPGITVGLPEIMPDPPVPELSTIVVPKVFWESKVHQRTSPLGGVNGIDESVIRALADLELSKLLVAVTVTV